MKHNRLVLRVAALISSVSMVAVYVSCRSAEHKDQAQNPVNEPDSKTFMGGSKSREVFPPEPTPAAQSKEPPRKTMGGSKSMMIVKPGDLPASQTPASGPK